MPFSCLTQGYFRSTFCCDSSVALVSVYEENSRPRTFGGVARYAVGLAWVVAEEQN